jgi:hypothetical protein
LLARGAAADEADDLEASDQQDIDELLGGSRAQKVPSSLPEDPAVARLELRDVERMLQRLNSLTRGDSKLEHFMRALQVATSDGRACLVFSEFTDTVEYLRENLFPTFGAGVACYTGDGGAVYESREWHRVSKEEITSRLSRHEIRVLLCSDAASEGLNLQVASALINYDLPWNPARVEQRIGRIDRIGQLASDLRIVNLVLADSVDERVYQLLSQRCDVFRSYVGAMQPVLSVARRMLLGVQPFNAAELNAEADRATSDALADAAFRSTEEGPPAGKPPGVTIEDFVRAYDFLRREFRLDIYGESRPLTGEAAGLADDPTAIPLSPFVPELRAIGNELNAAGELLPLVVDAVERGSFRAVVAVWAGSDGNEIVERAERLEGLLGMWDGATITPAQWKEAHAVARGRAERVVDAMCEHALREEKLALERQVEAARKRLLRELGRFLACASSDSEDFNLVFHHGMQRGGQVGALLVRAHGLVGYPDWPRDLVRAATDSVERLTANQRTNVLLGTPLEAAVRDPRWAAASTIAGEWRS